MYVCTNNSGILTLFPSLFWRKDNCGIEFTCLAQKCVVCANQSMLPHQRAIANYGLDQTA